MSRSKFKGFVANYNISNVTGIKVWFPLLISISQSKWRLSAQNKSHDRKHSVTNLIMLQPVYSHTVISHKWYFTLIDAASDYIVKHFYERITTSSCFETGNLYLAERKFKFLFVSQIVFLKSVMLSLIYSRDCLSFCLPNGYSLITDLLCKWFCE